MTHIIGAGCSLFFKVVSKIYSHHENVKVGYSRIGLWCLMPHGENEIAFCNVMNEIMYSKSLSEEIYCE
jgi:hypothetical protein